MQENKTAVVLFNLGGPDNLQAVQPFLYNLFSDKAIIRLPLFFRLLLAKIISSKRAPIAQKIYAQMGGKSPILEQTESQAKALEAALGQGFQVFTCMRYWHPMAKEVVRKVAEFSPARVVLLPLYPQFSTTTTASSFQAWEKEAALQKLSAETHRVCCYPVEKNLITSHVELLRPALEVAAKKGDVRVLFSAHGLPEKYIRDGDSYQWQVEQTVAEVIRALAMPNLDFGICYQSRVGRLVWIGPATDAEIIKAAEEKKSLVVVPVAFVSEHSETLVELDIEYAELAHEHGASAYTRVPALGVQTHYIQSLAAMVKNTLLTPCGTAPDSGGRICPASFSACLCAR